LTGTWLVNFTWFN